MHKQTFLTVPSVAVTVPGVQTAPAIVQVPLQGGSAGQTTNNAAEATLGASMTRARPSSITAVVVMADDKALRRK